MTYFLFNTLWIIQLYRLLYGLYDFKILNKKNVQDFPCAVVILDQLHFAVVYFSK